MAGTNIDYSKSEAVIEQEQVSYILTAQDADLIMENNAFKVRDMYFVGNDGFVKWTKSITNLRAGMQTRGHSHPDKDEKCRIEMGECFVIIEGKSHRVKAGHEILIERGSHHKVINISTNEECVFVNEFPGHLIRPGFVRKRD